nr:LysE family translocator [Kineosporia babensis]
MPGLDTALVLRSAAAHGRAHAFATALGINTGALIWGVAAAAGATALLTASETAYTVLRFAGAGYLVWMGFGLLRSLWRRSASVELGAAVEGRPRLLVSYRRGMTTNLLNPKIGVFYMAMIPQFIPEGTSHLLMGVLLALVHDIEGMVWFTALILGVERIGAVLRRLRVRRRTAQRSLDGVTGVVLIGFGVDLAVRQH